MTWPTATSAQGLDGTKGFQTPNLAIATIESTGNKIEKKKTRLVGKDKRTKKTGRGYAGIRVLIGRKRVEGATYCERNSERGARNAESGWVRLTST